jgi:hypothetical protein
MHSFSAINLIRFNEVVTQFTVLGRFFIPRFKIGQEHLEPTFWVD